MVRKLDCKYCQEKNLHFSYCTMECARRGKNKIYPKKITILEIKKCLENNIGCFIDISKISIYSKEIERFLENEGM